LETNQQIFYYKTTIFGNMAVINGFIDAIIS